MSRGRLPVKDISDMFGAPPPPGQNEILFPITVGKDGEFAKHLAVDGIDRESDEIIINKESLKNLVKEKNRKLVKNPKP